MQKLLAIIIALVLASSQTALADSDSHVNCESVISACDNLVKDLNDENTLLKNYNKELEKHVSDGKSSLIPYILSSIAIGVVLGVVVAPR